MADRRSLSKRLRFEIFKRDQFTCQYCGRMPPAVVLEVDHVIAVAETGADDEHNLLTACFDCNRGKGARSFEATAVDVGERTRLLEERMAQVHAYDELLREHRQREEQVIDEVTEVYERAFKKWTLADATRPSIRDFLRRLPQIVVVEAMELACSRMNSDRAFRYFCGVCWNRIRDLEGE